MPRALRSIAILALVGLAWIVGRPVLANSAAPWTPGDVVGEPVGPFRQLGITAETLAFDLRPLARGERALVSATYRIENAGALADVELIFVSPAIEEGQVDLDGAPIPSEPVTDPTTPPEWHPPSTAPAIGGGELPYVVRPQSVAGILFRARFAPGTHELTVRYAVVPSEYHDDAIFRNHELGYVLAPARSWASFGVLTVSIDLPPAWQAATSLPMERAGDRLTAAFSGVPADALAVTVRQPPLEPDDGVMWGALLGGGVAAVVFGVACGWVLSRAGVALWIWLIVAPVVAAAGAASGVIAAVLALDGWVSALDSAEISRAWSASTVAPSLQPVSVGSAIVVGLLGMLVAGRRRTRATGHQPPGR